MHEVAEAAERLEQFHQRAGDRKHDVILAERALEMSRPAAGR